MCVHGKEATPHTPGDASPRTNPTRTPLVPLVPLPSPLAQVREVVVVHTDQGFLDDLTGACRKQEEQARGLQEYSKPLGTRAAACPPSRARAAAPDELSCSPVLPPYAQLVLPPAPAGDLREYVEEEVNVRALTPCADPLKHCRCGDGVPMGRVVQAMPRAAGWFWEKNRTACGLQCSQTGAALDPHAMPLLQSLTPLSPPACPLPTAACAPSLSGACWASGWASRWRRWPRRSRRCPWRCGAALCPVLYCSPFAACSLFAACCLVCSRLARSLQAPAVRNAASLPSCAPPAVRAAPPPPLCCAGHPRLRGWRLAQRGGL